MKDITLIHYVGNDGAMSDFSHRNSTKVNCKAFFRTCPSYMKCESLVADKKPNIVYKKEIASKSCHSKLSPVMTPRNLKQLRNLRFKKLNYSRISRDSLYNLHEIAYDLTNFVWKIVTFPDLVCICGLDEIAEDANKLLMLSNTFQLLSYDTTFQLGDFYVSPLIVRYSIFDQKPCVPLAFMIHERKFSSTHQEMLHECTRKIPSLRNLHCPIVVDKEKAIINAIRTELPDVPLLLCWNHLFRDVRLWCHKHGASSSDITVYIADMKSLFHAKSATEYDTLLQKFKRDWDALFEEYFRKEIHGYVHNSIGRWVLEANKVYNPYSGVTNNQSEGYNRYVVA